MLKVETAKPCLACELTSRTVSSDSILLRGIAIGICNITITLCIKHGKDLLDYKEYIQKNDNTQSYPAPPNDG